MDAKPRRAPDREVRVRLGLGAEHEVGAELLETTNEYELLRFRANGTSSIVYRKSSGRLTWTGESEAAWQAFSGNGRWRGNQRSGRNRRKLPQRLRAVIERDGRECFFCGEEVPEGEETEEHLVPLAHRGPNHLSNLALTHERCNQHAGHLSVVEKVRLRDCPRSKEDPSG